MNWQAVGAIGEIFGALAVVGTLVYLAAQIRASTRQSRASMVQSVVEAFNGTHDAIMVNPQMADVFAKKHGGVDLSPSEEIQWDSCINRIFNIYSSIQRAYDGGQMEREYYETCCLDVARTSLHYGWADSMRKLLLNFPNESKLGIFAGLYDEANGQEHDA